MSQKGLEVAFICARFDKPDLILQRIAARNNIPFFTSRNINSPEFIARLQGLSCDLFVSMSFDQIFKKELFKKPRLGTINCHAGKLPFYRGRNVLNWALINDESEFGVTVHYVDEGIDTGDIIVQECFPISEQDTYKTLLDRAYSGCAALLNRAVYEILAGKIVRTAQSEIHQHGFYCVARSEGDERINWNQPSRAIFNFVRAICPPGPSAKSFIAGEEILIHRVRFLPDAPIYIGIPGSILAKDSGGFLVKTSDSFVRVEEWQSRSSIRVGNRLV